MKKKKKKCKLRLISGYFNNALNFKYKSSPHCFNSLFPLDTDPNMTPFLHPFKNRDPLLKVQPPASMKRPFFSALDFLVNIGVNNIISNGRGF